MCLKKCGDNDNSVDILGNFILIILCLVVVFFLATITTHAEEADSYSIWFNWSKNSNRMDPELKNNITESSSVVSGPYQFFLYYMNYDSIKAPYTVHIGFYVPEENKCYLLSSSSGEKYGITCESFTVSTYDFEGKFIKSNDYTSTTSVLTNCHSGVIYDKLDFYTDGYVFKSFDDATRYFVDHDNSGLLDRPDNIYDYDHDFRQDEYDPDVPVPELSKVSYNGFVVNNADPSRDIEIYITTSFYGVKHGNNSSSDLSSLFVRDNGWVYAAHRYNLINTDISYSDNVVNLEKMYNVSPQDALVSDFSQWSVDYSSHKKLPDYSFFKHSASAYDDAYSVHLYKPSVNDHSAGHDLRVLKESRQASITYFVRFCQLQSGEGYSYGKWISYTYTPGDNYHSSDVVIGDVVPDSGNGSPTVTNPVPGTQDEDGNFTPSSGIDIGNWDLSAGNIADVFMSVINNFRTLVSYYTEFGEFLTATFKFIPYTIWSLIECGFAISVVILIYKYVRGM